VKASDIRVTPLRVPITVPYRIAGRTFDTAEILVVEVEDETGLTGYGAGSPVSPLTGDDFESATRALTRDIVPALRGADVSDLPQTISRARAASGGAMSALAALDIALHDLHARRRGLPLASMLGDVRGGRLITSITIGIGDPEAMAESALRHVSKGFRALKVKIGESLETDLLSLKLIREAVGQAVAIRVDANQGYSRDQALRAARAMEPLGIEIFEQPVAATDLASMAAVTAEGRVPVLADEAVKTAEHLPPLIAAKAACGANIKLMKCGGLDEALRIDRALHEAGLKALVGCMDESRASIAAAAHFAASASSVAWIDLDGHLDLAEDPFTGGFEIVDGEILLGDAPGLGVSPR